MENNFYTEHFERLIKEKSDEFKMIPSKRVWHSIYNDLHPSRKWPSIAMCIVLLVSIMYLGYLNKNSDGFNDSEKALAKNSSKNLTKTTLTNNNQVNNGSNDLFAKQLTNSKTNIPSADYFNQSTNILTADNNFSNTKNNKSATKRRSDKVLVITTAAVLDEIIEQNLADGEVTDKNVVESINAEVTNLNNKESEKENLKVVTKEDKKLIVPTVNDENVQAKIPKKTWKDKTALEIYATPSIGYRNMNAGPEYSSTAIANGFSSNGNDIMFHKPALNLEAGVGLSYSLAKNLKVKGGIQINYTNYGVSADEIDHPVSTTLIYKDATGGTYIASAVSTSTNSFASKLTTLHNRTFQVSLPLGAAVKLMGNKNMDWYVGATVQPSYVFGGNANIISSDRQYYITDPSLIRKWNFSTAIETYFAYKVGNYNLHVGPQVRYQLLSTYDKKLALSEKLYNVGLKVGLVKSF